MLQNHWSLDVSPFQVAFAKGEAIRLGQPAVNFSEIRGAETDLLDRPNGRGQVSMRKKKFCPVSRKPGRRRAPKEVETDLSIGLHQFSGWWHLKYGLIFKALFGEDSQFDEYFSDGLKPPTSQSLDHQLLICFRKGKCLLSSNFNWNWFNDCCVWIQRSCSQMSFVRSVLRLVKYMTYVVLSVIFCHMSKTFGIFWWNKRLFCVFLCTCCVSAQVVEHHEKKEFIEKIQKEPVFLQVCITTHRATMAPCSICFDQSSSVSQDSYDSKRFQPKEPGVGGNMHIMDISSLWVCLTCVSRFSPKQSLFFEEISRFESASFGNIAHHPGAPNPHVYSCPGAS